MTSTKNYWVQITKVSNESETDYKRFECNTLDEVNQIIDQYDEDNGYANYYGSDNGSPLFNKNKVIFQGNHIELEAWIAERRAVKQ